MKRQAADRHDRLRPGAILAVVLAVALLALGGCGDFNKRSGGGGLTVSFGFAGFGGGGSSTLAAGSTTQGITFTGLGDKVESVVVGAIVITHPNGSGPGGAFQPGDETTISTSDKDLLEEDVKASLKYLVIETLPASSNFVSFLLPADYADVNWQLVAVGLRKKIDYLTDIAEDSPIWFGFSNGFLNGKVGPGDEAPAITLQPWCAPGNKYPPGTPPC